MSDLSIKIRIADREYPLKTSAENEESLRKVGKAINEKFIQLKQQLKIEDKQDLLAMVAFYCMREKILLEEEKLNIEKGITDKLVSINKLIGEVV